MNIAITEIVICDVAIVIFKKCFSGSDNKSATCGIGTLQTKNAHKNNVIHNPYVAPYWYPCIIKTIRKIIDNMLYINLFNSVSEYLMWWLTTSNDISVLVTINKKNGFSSSFIYNENRKKNISIL